MVEQLPVKELVPGSSPGRGAKKLDTNSSRYQSGGNYNDIMLKCDYEIVINIRRSN